MQAHADAEVARNLNVTPQSLAAFKKQGRFPGGLLIDYCNEHDIPIDWLLYGQGRMYKKQVRGWKYSPKSPSDAVAYIKKKLPLSTNVVLIITYDDYLDGIAHGFVWDNMSMDGYATRSEVKNDCREALKKIYQMLLSSKISFYELKLGKEAAIDIEGESMASLFEKYNQGISETFMGMELTKVEVEEPGEALLSRAKGKGQNPAWETASRKLSLDDIRPKVEYLLKNHKRYQNLGENISLLLLLLGELASSLPRKAKNKK